MLRLVLKCCSRWMNCSRSSAAVLGRAGSVHVLIGGSGSCQQAVPASLSLSTNYLVAAGTATTFVHACHPAVQNVVEQFWLAKAVHHPCMPRGQGRAPQQAPVASMAQMGNAGGGAATNCQHHRRMSPGLPALRATLMTAGSLRLRRLMRPSTPSAAGTCRAEGGRGQADMSCTYHEARLVST